jgi:hypothetical protein
MQYDTWIYRAAESASWHADNSMQHNTNPTVKWIRTMRNSYGLRSGSDSLLFDIFYIASLLFVHEVQRYGDNASAI